MTRRARTPDERQSAHDRLREGMAGMARSLRDQADETALMYGGVDDPLHPWGPQTFRDWHDFLDRACWPLIKEPSTDAEVQAALALFRKANPHYIAVCLVMAARSTDRYETDPTAWETR